MRLLRIVKPAVSSSSLRLNPPLVSATNTAAVAADGGGTLGIPGGVIKCLRAHSKFVRYAIRIGHSCCVPFAFPGQYLFLFPAFFFSFVCFFRIPNHRALRALPARFVPVEVKQ